MISCVKCGRTLPLIKPDRHKPVSWACTSCGVVYVGKIDTRCSGRKRRDVLPIPNDSAIEGVRVGEAECPSFPAVGLPMAS